MNDVEEPQRAIGWVTERVVEQMHDFWLDDDSIRQLLRTVYRDKPWGVSEEVRRDVLAPLAQKVASLSGAQASFVLVSFMSSMDTAFRTIIPRRPDLVALYTEAVTSDLLKLMDEASR